MIGISDGWSTEGPYGDEAVFKLASGHRGDHRGPVGHQTKGAPAPGTFEMRKRGSMAEMGVRLFAKTPCIMVASSDRSSGYKCYMPQCKCSSTEPR
jgi:hypothetical protein